MTQKQIGMHKVKMFLFARWMATCYSTEELNSSPGSWWKAQVDYFERVVMKNYKENGSYNDAKEFFAEKVDIKDLENKPNFLIEETGYLVRPTDFSIWEKDPENGCYRSYGKYAAKYGDGTLVNAQKHFTFKNLTKNYDWFPITKKDIPEYQRKHDFQLGFDLWQTRSDGHGGIKGGTMEEYLQYLENVKKYKKSKEK